MPQATQALSGNLLIAALPRPDRQRLLGECEQIELLVPQALCMPGDRIRDLLFPTDGLISLITAVPGHPSLCIGMIGDEGVLGLWSMLGATRVPFRADVQRRGMAWRVSVVAMRRQFDASAALRRELNRYVCVMLLQRAQAIACACYHTVEPRLARWLLMTRDRAHSDDFHVTHEALAGILGVRRAGITRAASALQMRRMIRYSRGDVSILDGRALEAAACDCYEADRRIYAGAMA